MERDTCKEHIHCQNHKGNSLPYHEPCLRFHTLRGNYQYPTGSNKSAKSRTKIKCFRRHSSSLSNHIKKYQSRQCKLDSCSIELIWCAPSRSLPLRLLLHKYLFFHCFTFSFCVLPQRILVQKCMLRRMNGSSGVYVVVAQEPEDRPRNI